MSLGGELKRRLTPEYIAILIEKNDHIDVNFYGLIADIKLAVLDIAYEYFKKHKTHAAMALGMNRTTFTEKYKKFKG